MDVQPSDCGNWDYEDFPDHRGTLQERLPYVLAGLRKRTLSSDETAADTRSVHYFLFKTLTPPDKWYFAGNYRGEAFRCLRLYEVGVEGDKRVGYPASSVLFAMRDYARMVRDGLGAIDEAVKAPLAQLQAEDRLLYVVALAARVFELFLRIHPYANGNGHAGRLTVWAILGRYDYWPVRLTLDPRPGPPYLEAIKAHRNGNFQALEQYLMQCILNALKR